MFSIFGTSGSLKSPTLSEQREQPEQPEQREQFMQLLQFFRLSSAACAASREPKYSTLHLLPLLSSTHVVMIWFPSAVQVRPSAPLPE
jgi:hypothetical protein